MGEKLKQMRAAAKAAKEARQREIDKMDKQLCKAFAQVESTGGKSGGTRPARQAAKKDVFDRFPGGFEPGSTPQPVSTDSAAAARARMNERMASDEPNYNGMNAYQAKIARQRRSGEIPD